MSIPVTRPPPLNNWWRCHNCDREVNYDAWGESCPDCGHGKCDYCAEFSSGSYTTANNQTSYDLQIGQYARPPSMDGWWKCCQCGTDVNAAWYGDDCTSCSHHKCEDCGPAS
ncbi:hypothetical protein B0O99DRAFT_514409 [Bisporella sp. PMI_857]|nr:hypothetical protein B0O99DRAFT_514409 [Bisporella sp. PMI_857]